MKLETGTTELVVRQMRWESQDVMSVRLERTDGAAVPTWTAGAHLDIHLGRGLVRQYSLCGDPADKIGYRIAVLRDPLSRGGSRHVHDTLRPGQVIPTSEPRNNFELLDSPKYLFLAGGIGITPILTMIGEAERRGAEWELYYGGRTRETMAFLDELEHYGDRVHIVSEDREGRLDLPGLLETPARRHPRLHLRAGGPARGRRVLLVGVAGGRASSSSGSSPRRAPRPTNRPATSPSASSAPAPASAPPPVRTSPCSTRSRPSASTSPARAARACAAAARPACCRASPTTATRFCPARNRSPARPS